MGEPLLGRFAAGACASLAVVAGLIFGEARAGVTPPPSAAALLAVVLLAFALAALKHPRWSGALLLLGIFCLGLARGERAHDEAAQAADWARACRGSAYIRGRLLHRQSGTFIEVRAIRRRADRRIILIDPPLKLLLRGSVGAAGTERIEGLVSIETATGRRSPGAWDDRSYLAARGAGGWLRSRLIVALSDAGGCTQRPPPRDGLACAIARWLPGDPGLFSARFLLGRRVLPGAGRALQCRLQRAGVGHLWAVSGLHVGIVLGIILLFLRSAGLDRIRRGILAALLVPFYSWATGASSAALRAGMMGSLWCVLRAAGRRAAARDLLLMVLAGTLWLRPGAWREPGVQMSYLITLGILGLLGDRGLPRRYRPAALIAGAQMTAWPLQLAHFGWGSPFFLISNAVFVPLASALMPLLLAGLLLAAVPGYPPDLALAPARVVLEGMLMLLDGLGHLCDCWVIGGQMTSMQGTLLALLVVAVCSLRRISAGRRLLFALTFCLATVGSGHGEPHLLMLDVGQGEGWLIFLKSETWAVDLGPPPGAGGRASDTVSRALRSRGRTRIDRLFLTHDDQDHTGGIAELIAGDIRVRDIYYPRSSTPPAACAGLAGADFHGLQRGDSVVVGEVAACILHPSPAGTGGGSDNAQSLALRITMEDLILLLCGDVPGDVQCDWCREQLPLQCAIVTAAHHGSGGSTPREFLAATGAQLLLISAGRNNRFGHPAPEVITAAREFGLAHLRTDRDGTILICRRKGSWIALGSCPGSGAVSLSTLPPSVVGAP